MDVRRSRQLRTGACFALPALALALCTVLGLSATTATHTASGKGGHSGQLAIAPAHRPLAVISRMQDPIGFDLVVAEHATPTSHAADAASASVPGQPGRVALPAEHNRGPPGGKQV